MKRFFSSLETERIDRKVCRSRDAATADVFDYIERLCDTVRRRSTIDCVDPVEFGKRHNVTRRGAFAARRIVTGYSSLKPYSGVPCVAP